MSYKIAVVDQDTDEGFLIAEAFRIVFPDTDVRELQEFSAVYALEDEKSHPNLIVMDYEIFDLLSSEQLTKITSQCSKLRFVVLSPDPHYLETAQTGDALEFYEKPGTLEGFLRLARRITGQFFG